MEILKAVVITVMCFFNLVPFIHSFTFNATVSLDGSMNDFKTIAAAIAAAPDNSNTRFYIRVTPGTYHERLQIPPTKTFIALIGDNALTTIIVDDRSNARGFKTSDSATLTVNGDNFIAKSLTFENSAGPQNGQAVAVLDQARFTAYHKCRFLGFQDTLYVGGKSHFFKECDVYGTVDFIFGNGLTMFQDCNIYAREPNRPITVTAQSKEQLHEESGFSFQNCTVTVSSEIVASKANVKIYLDRPWRQYSRVVFMESFLDEEVLPEGWSEWPGVPTNNLFYGEFNNRGPGADVSKRVHWIGFHLLNKQLANQFTIDNFVNGSYWLPETGIPFRRGFFS
ncbi:putative pectinesterase/pectinesterase inhibitor 41 [Cucumis melo var. makuwa]|uniref:Pectinesterase n=1 Tax=Cucumis melo var. makuwa TaxID=1194695 RepID=A0A5D3BHF7_CUCMM|nr:putative pectinesterase/pectinesterase inhibitor 41 [Cucumis melo var. makuwa]TYJ99210.1 putative pectinesterase/pectinesterase inhibitor 41 [Cucumis melo var. makuwa]